MNNFKFLCFIPIRLVAKLNFNISEMVYLMDHKNVTGYFPNQLANFSSGMQYHAVTVLHGVAKMGKFILDRGGR